MAASTLQSAALAAAAASEFVEMAVVAAVGALVTLLVWVALLGSGDA
jgi:hypothetical protein